MPDIDFVPETESDFQPEAETAPSEPSWKSLLRPIVESFVQAPTELPQNISKVAETVAKPVQETGGALLSDFLRRTGIDPSAQAGQNIIDIPSIEQRLGPDEMNRMPTAVQALIGYHDAAARAASGFTEPGMAAALPLLGTKPAQSVIAAHTLSSIPSAVDALYEAKTPSEKAAALTEAAINLGIGAGVSRHLLKKGVTDAPQERLVQESSQPEYTGTETQRLPTETVSGDSPQPETPVQAKEDVVTAATFTNPETGETTTAPNHPEAQLKQGMEPTQPREARETPDFGFEVTTPTGEKEVVSRPEAEHIAEQSGQLLKEPTVTKRPIGDYPKGTQVSYTGAESKDPLNPWVEVQFPDGKKLQVAQSWLGQTAKGEPLPSIVGRLGRDKVNSLLNQWERDAELSPDGKSIVGVLDPRNQKGRARLSSKEFSSWLKEQESKGPVHSDEIASPVDPSKPLSEVHQPEQQTLKGMGGAVPSEFELTPQTPTGIKNAQVDIERQKRGLPPAMEPVKRSFGEVWDRAMALVDRDPAYQDNLIDSLEKKPRALTDVEDALVLQRQIALQNEYGKATRDLAQSYDDGRTEAADAERVRVAGLSDQLLRLYNLGKKVGTETGRGLAARKMMAYEDYSLAKMTLDLRAAKGGKPLTPEETNEVTRLNQKIQETQKSYDDYRASTESRIASAETARVLAEMKAKAPSFDKRILAQAESIVSRMEQAAKPAADRLRERLSRMSAGVDPTIVSDAAIVGSAKIARAGLDLARFTDEMVREFGEKLRPMINDIWTEANKLVDNASKVKAVRNAIKRNATLSEVKDSVSKSIGEKVAQGKKDEITWFVQKLARELVRSGISDREQLIDAVHDVIKDAVPGITRRGTMDAISGYGDFKQLTKDQISIKLRGMKGEMQQLAKLEDMAKAEPPKKSGVERRTPTEAERLLIKEVNDAKNKFQVPVSDPSTQLKSALDTLKTTLRNRIADYQDRLQRGDFAPRPRREVVLDPEATKLKVESEKAKKAFQRQVQIERLKNATAVERGANWVTKWRRGFILSGFHTLGKLTAAALQRVAFTPAEEAVGGVIGKAIPSVASKAAREGGFSAPIEARALASSITKGMKDAWQTLRTGQSELDILHGKEALLPPTAIDFFGHVHGALKAPTKRAEFTRSVNKRLNHAITNGVDVTDPLVQSRLVIEAYKDANRSIFLQDNRVVDAYKRGLQALERKDKTTGEVPLGGKVAATTARVLLPIVKVPTNIVAETMQYAVGSVTGSARLARAFSRGIENLKPEEADIIMRHLKKGSLGLAVMALGYLNPDVVGGYYQPGEKRKKGDVKAGSMKFYGQNIPSFLLHNPLLETAQIGATIRRVADSKLNKKDLENQGIGNGVIAAAVGVGENVPFIREQAETVKLLNPRQRGQFLGELGKSLLIPRFLQEAAEVTDTDAAGNPIARKPRTATEYLKSGVPGLREEVPKKK